MKFYKEWLPLEKKQFRIVSMLADKGKYEGNLSELCDYFLESRQTKNRNAIRESIYKLRDSGFITVHQRGRTLTIEAIPKDEEIEISKEWYDEIRLRPPSQRSVSWEAVLKVLLWAHTNNYEDVITNKQIEMDLNISSSVICSAKGVLDEEFGAIVREKVSEKIGENEFKTIGQHLSGSAFWNKN